MDHERGIVWLCAAHRRESGSQDDAYNLFADLHDSGILMPDDDDRLRDRAEAVIRLQRDLTTELLELVDAARAERGTEQRADLGGWIPCRVVAEGELSEEIWCALCIRGNDGKHVPAILRDLLVAGLEKHVAPAESEVRTDWPWGAPEWFELVVLCVR